MSALGFRRLVLARQHVHGDPIGPAGGGDRVGVRTGTIGPKENLGRGHRGILSAVWRNVMDDSGKREGGDGEFLASPYSCYDMISRSVAWLNVLPAKNSVVGPNAKPGAMSGCQVNRSRCRRSERCMPASRPVFGRHSIVRFVIPAWTAKRSVTE